jgi:hypothetical protein
MGKPDEALVTVPLIVPLTITTGIGVRAKLCMTVAPDTTVTLVLLLWYPFALAVKVYVPPPMIML